MRVSFQKSRIIGWLALSIALLYVLYLRYQIVYSFASDVSGSEKNVIYGIQRLLADLPLYTDPTQIEFNLVQYTPIYFKLIYLTCSLFNISSEDPHAIFITSRIISFLLIVGSAGIYGSILRAYGHSFRNCVSAGILILFLHSANMLSNSRPDSLLSFFVAFFLFSGIRFLNTRNTIWNYLSVLSAVLAFWTKQNGAILMGCWFLILLLGHFHKQNVYNLLLFGLSICVLIFIENTEIKILKLNLIDGIRNGIHMDEFKKWILFKLWPLLPILGLTFVFSYKWLFHRSDRTNQFIAVTCLLLFFFNLITSLKQGSRIGYLSDYLCVAIVGTYIYLGDYRPSTRNASKIYNTAVTTCWVLTTVYFGIFSTLFASACMDPAHLARYRKEKSLAAYVQSHYLSANAQTRLIVVESFFDGQWTKHFLFRQVSAFASDALDMAPLNYSRLPEFVQSHKIKYLIRFKQTRIEPLGHKLSESKLLEVYDGVEIYCSSCAK